jgi:Tfp pilus assembly protein PilF
MYSFAGAAPVANDSAVYPFRPAIRSLVDCIVPRPLRKFAIAYFVGVGLGISASAAAPFVPADNDVVLERVPPGNDPVLAQIRPFREILARDPRNLDAAIEVARRYREIGRAEGDPRYDGYAEAALRPWWHAPLPPTPVRVQRATLRQARHDFDGALEDVAKILDVDPNRSQAVLLRAMIQSARGNHDDALESCGRLVRRVHPLARAACAGHALFLSGRSSLAYNLVRDALDGRADAELQLWGLTVLAEAAMRLGNDADAERHFRDALALGRRNVYLIGAYADFLLDRGRAAEARDLLVGEDRADVLLLRLALAERTLGAADAKRRSDDLARRFAANRARGERLHLREESRFTLHILGEPDAALRLARENRKISREPWDARVLLEAAVAARAPTEAVMVVDWLDRTRLEDGPIRSLARRLAELTR